MQRCLPSALLGHARGLVLCCYDYVIDVSSKGCASFKRARALDASVHAGSKRVFLKLWTLCRLNHRFLCNVVL